MAELMDANFTITRTTSNGIMEWLTNKGWRSMDAINNNNDVLKLWFSRSDGTKEVLKQKKDCRIKQLSNSIKLNYD